MSRTKHEVEAPSFPEVVTFRDFQGEVEPVKPVEIVSPLPEPEPEKPAKPAPKKEN